MVVKQAGTDISSTKGIKIRCNNIQDKTIKKVKKGVIKNSIHKHMYNALQEVPGNSVFSHVWP